MRNTGPRRLHRVSGLFTATEFEKVSKEFKDSTCRNYSEYIRERLMGEPQTIFYRNRTADEFLLIAIELKEQLVFAVNNMRTHREQSHSLHITSQEQFQAKLFWLEKIVKEITGLLTKIYEQWSQK
ncbi:MAG: hypothetical protein JST68_00540 [Bacteroidetes bacterium]|nr:hypothetical protein [Bacteroidota bacterium]